MTGTRAEREQRIALAKRLLRQGLSDRQVGEQAHLDRRVVARLRAELPAQAPERATERATNAPPARPPAPPADRCRQCGGRVMVHYGTAQCTVPGCGWKGKLGG